MKRILFLLGFGLVFVNQGSFAAPTSATSSVVDEQTAFDTPPAEGVTRHFFFIGSGNNPYRASLKDTSLRVVTTGQAFGVRLNFEPKKGIVHLRVRLQLPNSPERFPTTHGKVSVTIAPDRKSLTADEEVDGTDGTAALYWGIDSGDPRGAYELKFWFDDVEIDTYKFKVE